MSRRTVITCDGCGVDLSHEPTSYIHAVRINFEECVSSETFELGEMRVDLCDGCMRSPKVMTVIPDRMYPGNHRLDLRVGQAKEGSPCPR